MSNPTIFFYKGLIGSGKSYDAIEHQKKYPDTVRVNKDLLREMMHNSVHSKAREDRICEVRDFIIEQALIAGKDVLVDDTNLEPRHLERIQEIAEKHGAVVEIRDFTHVPLDVCIRQDLQRPKSLGEKIIRGMYNRYLRPPVPVVEDDIDLPDVVIADLDGTLAHFGKANPYERDFLQDKVNAPVRSLLWLLSRDHQIIICSGRKEKFREQSDLWLVQNDVPCDGLYMRRDDDDRPDYVVKKEMYEKHIKGFYNIKHVFDDRPQVCDLWYELGLPLFKVGDPRADF